MFILGILLSMPVAWSDSSEPSKKTEGKTPERFNALQQELLDSSKRKKVVATAKLDREVVEIMSLIQTRITENWERPKSARNGMEVMLNIFLAPSGNVVKISIIQGSGNSAFDRSAIRAIERVREIPEIADLPPKLFKQYFRQLHLLFRPEDLKN